MIELDEKVTEIKLVTIGINKLKSYNIVKDFY
jgi:hypothetical protein